MIQTAQEEFPTRAGNSVRSIRTDLRDSTVASFAPQYPKYRSATLDTISDGIVRDTFSDLSEVQSEHPLVQEIKRYGAEEVEVKLAYLKTPMSIPPWKAKLLFDRLPDDAVEAGFNSAVLRIGQETDYFKELDEVGIDAALLGQLDEGKYKAWVTFLAPDSFLARHLLGKTTLGSYFDMLDVVLIRGLPPTKRNMWMMLATAGVLPSVIASVDHELTHDTQTSGTKRMGTFAGLLAPIIPYATLFHYGIIPTVLSGLVGRLVGRGLLHKLTPDELLVELHAYNAEHASPTNGASNDSEEVVEHVLRSYAIRGVNLLTAIEAYHKIQTLRLLGYDDVRLGKIIQRARYDKDHMTYPVIDDLIATHRQELGLTTRFGFAKLIAALTARHELELKVQRRLAQEIAAEELQKEAGNWMPPVKKDLI